MVNGVVQNPRDFLRAVPAELEMTPCLWWRRAPKSMPLLDLSLILASLYGEGGENVGEHCQEGRHGGGEGIDEGSSMYMERRFWFLCLVHVSLPLCHNEDSVVFVYVSLLHDVAMTTCFAFALLYVQPSFNCTTLSCKSLVDIGFVV